VSGTADRRTGAKGDGTRFVWTADLLPDETAGPTGEMMERGIEVLKQAQEGAAAQ
jgi:hypothetical protein